VFVAPFLLLSGGAAHPAGAGSSARPPAQALGSRLDDVVLPSHLVRYKASLPTPTTAPVTTTTVAPVTTTTVAPSTTTTTTAPVRVAAPVVAVTPTTVAGPVSTGHSESGQATWYASYFPATGCASPHLPKGTVLTVTASNGNSITCTVDDLEQDTARVVDLSPTQFSELVPLSQGVVDVTATW
jgi:hypothetical protein